MSYDDFYRASYPRLLRLALARTGDRAAAEDLVQDALADAHRRWAQLVTYDDPLGWARRAVLNRAAGRWRRLGREAGRWAGSPGGRPIRPVTRSASSR